ncbi:MAG TPA: bifunctional serine/threonine-protein kinase/formylglycine-generating enzyme family protein [Pirellulales bacterium]|jgi:serine/threonine-protein kinase
MRAREHNLRQALVGLSVDLQIDAICDRFEKDLWAGSQPELTDYLSYVEEEHRGQLFVELLLVDWELRSHDKDASDWRVYMTRFPHYASQIEEARLKHSGEPAPPPNVLAPSRLGHFLLLESIGEGTSGKVWRAFDPRLQRTVALKIPHAHRLTDNALNRFLREGRAAAQLSHPRIVPVYEVGKEGGSVYIVSAYVLGQNLRDWLYRSRPIAREAARMCASLADALDHAHERGVIHRDLKPSNIILDEALNPHITDFGLAKCANDSRNMTLDGEIVGTPAYMSPEQASGKGIAADRRTDIFALGVILYEMLTGSPPFDGPAAALLQKVVHADPLPPRRINRSIPRDLETICLKAISKSPDDRYWSAQEMAVDLRRVLDGRPIVARRPSPVERAWRWIRRRPAAAAVVGLFALLAAAMGIAAQLASENHALLGLRTVTMTTSPAGAKVTFVPLDADLGEPLPDKAIRPRQRSPFSLEVPAGEYLVVAVLDDGRFNEVYRRVPREAETLPGIYAHLRWKQAADGSINLPKIRIPDADVTSNMALIAAPPSADPKSSKHSSDGAFYIDCKEFTVAEYRQFSHGKDPMDKRWRPVPDDYAVTVSFDLALALAESRGKRLPTENEFVLAASHRAPAPNPEASTDEGEPENGVGPVGFPSVDRTHTEPQVVGLCSNVAEWTVSRFTKPRPEVAAFILEPRERIVRGGNMRSTMGESSVTTIHKSTLPVVVSEGAVRPGLGFRCVRSATPRFVND